MSYPYITKLIVEEKVIEYKPRHFGLFLLCTGEVQVQMYWVKYYTVRTGLHKICRLFYTRDAAVDFANTLDSNTLHSYSIPGY